MATPMQSLQITFAADSFIGRKPFDLTVKYPFEADMLSFNTSMPPHTMLVALGNTPLTFDECQQMFDTIRMRLRELGVKPNDEMDIQYCCLLSEDNATWAQYILTYPA
jgi:hypothetical protein